MALCAQLCQILAYMPLASFALSLSQL